MLNRGPAAYSSILVAEEVLDRLQREQANDEAIQPLMRQVNRIHIMEEARHVSFARLRPRMTSNTDRGCCRWRLSSKDDPSGRRRLVRSGALGVEARRQAEQREERVGVEEERELGDPAALELQHLERPRLVAAVRARLVLPERG